MGTNQRDAAKMAPEEIRAFLEERSGAHTVSLASHNADGTIHLVGMFYAFLEGEVAFLAKRKSQKVVNVRRDPRVSCLIETAGSSYGQIRGVTLVGSGEVVDDVDRIKALAVDFVSRAFDEESRPSLDTTIYNRVAIKLHVERTVSWDHRKLV